MIESMELIIYGKYRLSFSFIDCDYKPEEKVIIEIKEYDIMSTGSYNVYFSLKERFNLVENQLKKSERFNYYMFGLAIFSLIITVIALFKKTKSIVVDIKDEVLDKIKKKLQIPKKKRIK